MTSILTFTDSLRKKKQHKREEMGSANSHQPAGKDKRREKSQQRKSTWGEMAK